MAKLKIVENFPVIAIGSNLVVTDLHLGYERTMMKKGVTVPVQTKKMIEILKKIQKKYNSKGLIILGDIKDKHKGIEKSEWREVPIFMRKCLEFFEKIIITKGNHDGAIEKLVDFRNVELVKEFISRDFGYMHGHAWPSKNLLKKCKTIVIGHSHPAFSYQDHLGNYIVKKVWIKGEINAKKLEIEYPKGITEIKTENIIVVPTFNPLFSGSKEKIGPIARYIKNEKVILLDGTVVS